MYRTLPDSAILPYALYRAAQVQALDKMAIEQFGIAGETLMQSAGQAAFDYLKKRWPAAQSLVILAGTGNNGGDGYVIARLALQAGLKVQVLQLGDSEKISGDAALHYQRFLQQGGVVDEFVSIDAKVDLIIDAMLGTGLQNNIKGQWLRAVEAVNAHQAAVLAIDLPSGLHADTGALMGNAVKADATISFIGLKQGMFTARGRAYCGEIVFDSLQIPARVYASQILSARRLDWSKLKSLLPARAADAHKGVFGHLLIIAGSAGYCGAARLAAEAALRSGCGLVSVMTEQACMLQIAAGRPEIMIYDVADEKLLAKLFSRVSAVVIGPGLGQTSRAIDLLTKVLSSSLPAVLDADALNLLSVHPELQALIRADHILTPHPGEAARLLDSSVAVVESDRFAALEAMRKRYPAQLVLKGSGSLIVDAMAKQPPAICSDGNPGMATAGMGDVLSGICGAFLAQQQAPRDAAELAVCLHAAAADRAAEDGQAGMLASDLFPSMRMLINDR